jgi:ATP synthase protein I
VIPVVGGAYLGRHLDRRHAGGQSWTLTLIILGMAVGVYNFWLYYRRRS